MTGSVLPLGTDSVIPWEETDMGDVEVEIRCAVHAGMNVRAIDEEVAIGQLLLQAGSRVTPLNISALVASGVDEISVVPRPRVAILITGDEIVGDSETLTTAHIRDSNRPLIKAFVEACGGSVRLERRIGDDESATTRAILEMSQDADLLVTTGGVSVGEHDWVRACIEKLGRIDFWRVAMRPGKPVLFGQLGAIPVLCMPGNPSSVIACCYLLLSRLLDSMSGMRDVDRLVEVPSADHIAGHAARVVIRPGWIRDGQFRAMTVSHPGLGGLASADGLAIIEQEGATPGTTLKVARVRSSLGL